MVVHALIWLTVTNAFVKFHILAETVTTKWIPATRIVVIMVQNAHQAQTIKILHAVAHLDILDACAIKTLTNVHCLHLVAMVQLVKIFPDHINVCVLTVMRDVIAPSTQMTVLHSHVRMAVLVWMELATLHVCAWMVSKANTVKLISMNALRVSVN